MTTKNIAITFVCGIVVGIIIGFVASMSHATQAHAATTGMPALQMVDSLDITYSQTLYKVYDNNNGAVCYIMAGWGTQSGSGVSCFKN